MDGFIVVVYQVSVYPEQPTCSDNTRFFDDIEFNTLDIPNAAVTVIVISPYLGSILPGLADRPINQTAELTPAAWADRKQSAIPATSSAV